MTRIRHAIASPVAFQAMQGLERFIRDCGLERPLVELVEIRASQINGCAFCLDMHWKDARAAGESEERLYMLPTWREATVYSPRERAALALTEAVTRIAEGGVPDAVYDEARRHFSDAELVNLTLAIVTINGWNRLGVTFQTEPGKYKPRHAHEG